MRFIRFIEWGIVIGIFLLIIGGTFLFVGFILSETMEHDKEIIKIDCYDKNNHKINDVTCNIEIKCNHKWDFLDSMGCKDNYVSSEEGE